MWTNKHVVDLDLKPEMSETKKKKKESNMRLTQFRSLVWSSREGHKLHVEKSIKCNSSFGLNMD